MKFKNFCKENLLLIAAAAVAFAVFIALNCFFPLVADDMEWATKPFTSAIITEFNGRYLGTLLTLVLTKVSWIRVITCAVITVALIYTLSLTGEGRRGFYFILAAFLFIIMPMSLFREVIAWTSGFANYVPSALIVAAYLVLVKREFSPEAPAYSKATPFVAAAVGVCGALFMETVTIGNIIVGAAVLIYHVVRFKKPNAVLISFLGGAVVGAVIMFINPVYLNIADGADPVSYRAINFSGIIRAYFLDFHFYFLYDNFPLNAFLYAMLAWFAVRRFVFLKKWARVLTVLCFAVQFVFILASGAEYFGGSILPQFRYLGALKGLLSAAYFAAVVAEVIILVDDINAKLYSILLLGSSGAYTATLLAVTPITARAFIYSYVIFVILAMFLFGENIKDSAVTEKRATLIAGTFAAAVIIALSAWYLSEYAEIHSVFLVRESEIIRQVNEGADEIVVKRLPDEVIIGNKTIKFVRYGNLDIGYVGWTMRLYYNIPDTSTIRLGD